ncbi:GRAS family protein [Enhygromyxa salina]|uniref:GRAS family protein n=1 Tax=Enhygromyxa salina TaxID=215803 RepID=UPI0011B26EC6|nr:GRAS family protein [Enhygromyxa salina]
MAIEDGQSVGVLESFAEELGGVADDIPAVDFFAGLSALELGRVASLWRACGHLDATEIPAATAVAESLIRAMPDEGDAHGAIAVRTFAETILGRCRSVSSSGGNLYLGARPPGAQLRAFELLRLRTPLIPFAYAAANKALLHGLPDGSEVTLIDVGIGRGGQLRALLRNPVARRQISRLHVVGVEPDSDQQSERGALELAGRQVLDTAAELGVEATFTAVAKRAEQLRLDDFPPMRGRVLANAAFAVHHVVPSGPGELDREGVLALLHELGAQTVVLTEPDSDHVDDHLPLRLLYAYRHYRSVAACLDATLEAAEARLVWTEFFAPEVRNVIGHDGTGRSERHELSRTWAGRLERAGWELDSPRDLVPRAGTPDGFALDESAWAFRLLFGGVPLLAVLRGRK